MKKITKVIKMSVTAIFTFIGLLFVSSLTANAAEGKELTKVVTDISVTDAGNNAVKPDANGNYNVTSDSAITTCVFVSLISAECFWTVTELGIFKLK